MNTKSTEKVVKEKQKTKKSTQAQSSIEKDLKALDATWSERFLHLEVMLVAKILKKLTFQTVKVTVTKKPPSGSS